MATNISLGCESTKKKICPCTKILLVDDNEYNLFVLSKYLNSVNLTADEAMNGKEAIDRIISRIENTCCNAYQLVVMDINMPIMGGIEASKIIREKINNHQIPYTIPIAASADCMKDDEREAFYEETGFLDYMPKPTTREAFFNLLRRYNII